MRSVDRIQVDVGVQNGILPAGGTRDYRSVGRADERLTTEGEVLFFSYPVAEGDEIAVLKGRDPHLGFIQTVWPLALDTSLWNDHDLGAG